MVEKIKSDIGDYLRRLRGCVEISDGLYNSLSSYIFASIENAYYEGAKNTEKQVQTDLADSLEESPEGV